MEDNKIDEIVENPLVVHKESDSSYQKSTDDYTMDDTHFEDEMPTLERHRFKKEQNKNNKAPFIIALIIIVAASVLGALYLTGVIGNKDVDTTTIKASTTREQTTTLQEAYKDTIVVKKTYIFVDGEEVDGIDGLQSALKYETPNTTRYTIIDEDADPSFLNDNVLPILFQMKFYDEKTIITHKNITGLVAEDEKTTVPTTKKQKSNNSKKESTSKSSAKSTSKAEE
ncbi:MAG: hypothetical protein ACI4IN_02085 [Eubacterium sp.]